MVLRSALVVRNILSCNRCFSNFLQMAEGKVNPETMDVEITEGKAKILFPTANSVFYNPVQCFNRDLSVAVINHYSKHYWNPKKRVRQKEPFWRSMSGDDDTKTKSDGETSEDKMDLGNSSDQEEYEDKLPVTDSSDPRKISPGLHILEALAASGLRSLRYALEIPLADRIIANDISQEAYHSICRNIEVNSVSSKVTASCKDANMLMHEHKNVPTSRYDVVDIDPYGSPTHFLDSAVQTCHDGGLLCVTCTDTSILCGNHSESCHAKYGSVSIKAKYCHEMSLRIILSCIESHANRYRRYIVPLLSCSIDFYCRVFVLVYTSAYEVKKSASKLSMVYNCNGCGTFHLQPLGRQDTGRKGGLKFTNASGPPVGRECEHCGSTFKFGGPIWTDPIHETGFVKGLLNSLKESKNEYKTLDRMEGLLTMASEELPDIPLYHVLDELCSTLHCNSINMAALRSAILNQGFRVSSSHTHPNAIKTDAPHHTIWDIMRCWVKHNPVKNIKSNSPAAKILKEEPRFTASFVIRKDANPLSKVLKLARFPENPEANWGPKTRAKRRFTEEKDKEQTKSAKRSLHDKPTIKVPVSGDDDDDTTINSGAEKTRNDKGDQVLT